MGGGGLNQILGPLQIAGGAGLSAMGMPQAGLPMLTSGIGATAGQQTPQAGAGGSAQGSPLGSFLNNLGKMGGQLMPQQAPPQPPAAPPMPSRQPMGAPTPPQVQTPPAPNLTGGMGGMNPQMLARLAQVLSGGGMG